MVNLNFSLNEVMALLPPLPAYVVGCRNGHKFFLSHQEVETHSPPLDFDLGHVICFGQWDLSECDTAEAYKVRWNSPSHAPGAGQHHVNEFGASLLYDGWETCGLACAVTSAELAADRRLLSEPACDLQN